MGIYIPGMDMPTSCGYCPLRYESDIGDACYADINVLTQYQTRPDDCPLVPVPPHGRLIDADELQKSLEYVAGLDWNISVGASKGLDAATCMVEDAQTVIPAEEGE